MATLNSKDAGKLKNMGMSESDIADFTSSYNIVSSNGKMNSGWGGLANKYLQDKAEGKAAVKTSESLATSSQYASEMANTVSGLTEKSIQSNLGRYPEVIDLAKKTTLSTATDLNAYMKSAYESTLDSLMPTWREDILGASATSQQYINALTEKFKTDVLPSAMAAANELSAQALSNVSAQLRGELPDDVAAQLKRTAAETAQQIGVRGQAAQYLTARDLGLTSLQLQQTGLANAAGALAIAPNAYNSFADTLSNPVKSATNVTNLLNAYKAPTVDVQSLLNANQTQLGNAALTSADSTMNSLASTVANAGSLAQSATNSGLEYTSQQYWNNLNLQLQQQALKAQKQASNYQLLGSVISGAAQVGAAAAMPTPV